MSVKVSATDMHTGGEPLRIITSGYPEIKGNTILEKRKYVLENFDQYRTMLMHEPRGHYEQYGALIVSPDDDAADIGVIFMHNEGYSTMCGHGVIALGRYIVDNKLHRSKATGDEDGEISTNILCPCGLVQAHVSVKGGVSGAVRFTSVPAFAYKTNMKITVSSYGEISIDIGYGGAFYALVDINQVGMDFSDTPREKLVDFADAVSQIVKQKVEIEHPEEADLSFLYGTILTDGNDAFSREPTYNLTVFADRQVDRSPTGSGVTARLAVQFAKGLIEMNVERKFVNGKVRSEFIGKVVSQGHCGKYDSVRVQVRGEAFYTDERLSKSSDQQLFITTMPPFKKASSDSLARWIKTTMTESGLETGIFSAHSCRSASTSKADYKGVSLSTIIKSASWSNENTFKKFYLKEIKDNYELNTQNFGTEILKQFISTSK